MTISRRAFPGAGLALAGVLPGTASAQGNEPWRIIVNTPPGAALDNTARLIADRAQREGRSPTIIENRPGANGNIGTAFAARARSDGRTALLSLDTAFTVNPHLYRDIGFDPVRDFVPVALINAFPLVLLVHPSTGIGTFAEFVAAARRAPMFYSSGGIGSPGHLTTENLRQSLGLPAGALDHAPQRGNAEAQTMLVSGNVPCGFLAIGGGPDLVRSGRLRALAVSGAERDAALPDVPTLAELGVAGFDARFAIVMLAPRGTPDAAIAEWGALARGVLADPATAPRFAGWGVTPLDGSAASAAAWLATNSARWGAVVRQANIRAE